jgi:PmbA protein
MEMIDRILDKCVRSGAEKAEVYYLSQKQLTLVVRDQKLETVKEATPGGLAIRYFSYGKSAFAHSTDISDQAIDKLIAGLARIVKMSTKKEAADLPDNQSYPTDLDIYDADFLAVSTEHKIEYLLNLEKQALKYDPLIEKCNEASYEETSSTLRLANTNGVDLNYDSTTYLVRLSVTAVKKDEMFPGEGEFYARYFTDLPKADEIVDKVASRAVRLIGGSTVANGDYQIILSPNTVWSIMWGLCYAINGENYLKGSSFLAEKTGQKISVDKLNVYDNPVMKRGLASRPGDNEGVASRKIAVIENGIFKTPLYDTGNAAKAGVSSTASAARRHYNDVPGIFPSNFYIEKGKDKAADVIASCKKGILVESTQGWGLHSVSGQYSAGINGELIKNGRRIKPVADVTIAADREAFFNGIEAICDDLAFYDIFSAPTIAIKRMKVGA